MARSLVLVLCLLSTAGCAVTNYQIGIPFIATFERMEVKPFWAKEPLVVSSWSLKPGWQNAAMVAGAAVGSLAVAAIATSLRRRSARGQQLNS